MSTRLSNLIKTMQSLTDDFINLFSKRQRVDPDKIDQIDDAIRKTSEQSPAPPPEP